MGDRKRMTETEFTKRAHELLQRVPPEFRNTFSFRAYERGHAGGFESELDILIDEIEEFLPAINAFRDRLSKSSAI